LSNREIGKAVGMLMMMHGVDEQEAFNVLRRYSQDLNIKLADVARSVIDRRGNISFGESGQSLGLS
jgi:AmiR/NasT family two-component response regulator